MTATNTLEKLEQDTQFAVERLISKVGEHFEYCRKQKGLTLRTLAKETGTSIAVVSDFENGIKIPRFDTLVKLMLRLDIPYNDVFGSKFFSKPDFIYNDSFVFSRKAIKSKKRADDDMRSLFFNLGYSKNEVKDILMFLDFIKSKRKATEES